MQMNNCEQKEIINATKWSAITEVLAKIFTPIISMILARILTPEAFGAVATISMVNAFADIFADAGFQKYIIQHEFHSTSERDYAVSVAFWANLFLSLLIWITLILFRNPLARLVGNPGLENAFIVAGISIPFVALFGLFSAVFKRELDFKTLFYARLVSVLVPLVVTIPLALLFRSFWALVFGTVSVNIANFVVLFLKNKIKIQFIFNFELLCQMFSFSFWVLIDAFMAWIACYLDIFLIGIKLSEYFLGLYKTSITLISQFFSIVSSTILPVLLPALSRTQNEYGEFRNTLLRFQKYTGLIVLPIGLLIFIYSDVITSVFLGQQWCEAAELIGLWGVTQTFILLFSRFCTVVYPAIGKPFLSVLSQVLYLALLIPTIIISSNYGFRPLYLTSCAVRFWAIFVDMIIVFFVIKLSPLAMLKNLSNEIIACVFMAVPAILVYTFNLNVGFKIASMIFSIAGYLIVLFYLPNGRERFNKIFSYCLTRIQKAR